MKVIAAVVPVAVVVLASWIWWGTYDGTSNVTFCMLRTSKAIAYAETLRKVEAYRPEGAFQDAIKALYVFGAKIVRPEQLYVFPIY